MGFFLAQRFLWLMASILFLDGVSSLIEKDKGHEQNKKRKRNLKEVSLLNDQRLPFYGLIFGLSLSVLILLMVSFLSIEDSVGAVFQYVGLNQGLAFLGISWFFIFLLAFLKAKLPLDHGVNNVLSRVRLRLAHKARLKVTFSPYPFSFLNGLKEIPSIGNKLFYLFTN